MMITQSESYWPLLAGCLLAVLVAGLSADRIEPHSDHQQAWSVSKGWNFTKSELVSYSFNWTIGNFSQYNLSLGDGLKSSVFPTGDNYKHKWQVGVFPNGYASRDFLSIIVYLKSVSDGVELPLTANYKIFIIDSNNQEIKVCDNANEFKPAAAGWGNYKVMARDILLNPASGRLQGDKLTLKVKIDVKSGQSIEDPFIRRSSPADLGYLFESHSFSDIVISVASREFKAHKAILAARSPVFRAMLSHQMQESQSSRVEVEDVEPGVFEHLLRYIYTGILTWARLTTDQNELSDIEDANRATVVIELLKAANKYQLDELRTACEQYLSRQMSVQSVVGILSLVDQYEADWLKSEALEFALSHAKELSESGAWRLLAKQSPEILAEIIARQASSS